MSIIREHDVVEGLLVHEVVEMPVDVRVLHRPPLQPDVRDPLAGVEGPVEHGAGADVLELGPDERAAFAGLHVLKVDHLEELAVDVEDQTVPEIGRGGHVELLSWEDRLDQFEQLGSPVGQDSAPSGPR